MATTYGYIEDPFGGHPCVWGEPEGGQLIEGFSPGQVLEPSEWEVHVLAVSL